MKRYNISRSGYYAKSRTQEKDEFEKVLNQYS